MHQSSFMDVKIEQSWKNILQDEFRKAYFKEITEWIKMEIASGKTIYPAGQYIFNAFEQTPFDHVKVVLIGQDPYHNPGQAHGLSFSVQEGIKPPPSLINIYKEIYSDLGLKLSPDYGNLTQWANQGILLLNAALTVRANEPGSHSKIGWAQFTDAVIQAISERKSQVVFLLWGRFAQEKQILIDDRKHCILKAAHPSPFSVEKGFYGCRHFSKTNEYLVKNGIDPIDWNLHR